MDLGNRNQICLADWEEWPIFAHRNKDNYSKKCVRIAYP